MKMMLGVYFPLIAYTIGSLVIAISSGTKKGINDFIYNGSSALAALALFGQMISVFSFGIAQSLRNFLLIIVIATIPGVIAYLICISSRKKEMLRNPLFLQALQLAQNPRVTEIRCSGDEICFFESGSRTPSQSLPVSRSFFSILSYGRSGYQISPSKELKWFAKQMARRLGGCKVIHDLKTDKIITGSNGYVVHISGNSGTVTPNNSLTPVVVHEYYHIRKKSR